MDNQPFTTDDFVQDQAPTLGRGSRVSQITDRMQTFQQDIVKNAEAAKRRAETLARKRALAEESMASPVVSQPQHVTQESLFAMPASIPQSPSRQMDATLAQVLLSNPDIVNMLSSMASAPGPADRSNCSESGQLQRNSPVGSPEHGQLEDLSTNCETVLGLASDNPGEDSSTFAGASDITSRPLQYVTPSRRLPMHRMNLNDRGIRSPQPGVRLTQRTHTIPPDEAILRELVNDPFADKENTPTGSIDFEGESRKRKACDNESSADTASTQTSESTLPISTTPTSSPVEGPAKKKKKDVMGGLTQARRNLVNISILYFRHLMLTHTPWVKENSDTADTMALDAWNMALHFLTERCNYSGEPIPTEAEINIIKQRLAQYRGEIKDTARKFVRSVQNPAFRFLTPHTIEAQNRNHELVLELKAKETGFIFKNRNPGPGEAKVYYGSPLIDCVVNAVWFNDGLKSDGIREGFFPDNIVPIPALALIVTAIEFAIDEWASGIKQSRVFSMDNYMKRYKAHEGGIQAWDAWSISSGTNESIVRRKQLFMNGRAMTGITAQEEAAANGPSVGNFTASDFEADHALASLGV